MPSSFASYLRVYEPLVAFDRQRQRYWRRYAEQGMAIAPQDGPDRQLALVLEAIGPHWTRLPDLPEEAYVLESDETLLICPWNLRVRVAEAALQARDGVPRVLADAFVPPAFADLAKSVVRDWRSSGRDPDSGVPRVHERASAWGVPLRWFACFGEAERVIALTGQRRIVHYRTELFRARRRVNRAASLLRRTVGGSEVTEAVEEIQRWLEVFHPRSVVELDYGGLVDLLPDDALLADDSPALVARGLAAVADGDSTRAASAYEQLVERWRAVQSLERCN